jgi:hypothetical protein
VKEDDTSTFVWHLLGRGLIDGDALGAGQLLATAYPDIRGLSNEIDAAILRYWTSFDRDELIRIALNALNACILGPDRKIRIVALLLAEGRIDLDEAFRLLELGGLQVPDDQCPSIRHVVDVCWLLRQDLERGDLRPGDDTLLKDALLTVHAECKRRHGVPCHDSAVSLDPPPPLPTSTSPPRDGEEG